MVGRWGKGGRLGKKISLHLNSSQLFFQLIRSQLISTWILSKKVNSTIMKHHKSRSRSVSAKIFLLEYKELIQLPLGLLFEREYFGAIKAKHSWLCHDLRIKQSGVGGCGWKRERDGQCFKSQKQVTPHHPPPLPQRSLYLLTVTDAAYWYLPRLP